jgi:hypothetical protein
MSIKNFNAKFGDMNDYESRREQAIDTYYQGNDLRKDLAVDLLKKKLQKEDSTIYLDTDIYIQDNNPSHTAGVSPMNSISHIKKKI